MTVPELSPEELLDFVKKSFDVPVDTFIDMFPLRKLVSLVATWNGERGQEPQWMLKADAFLAKELYGNKSYREGIVSEEEFIGFSISGRASIYDILSGITGANEAQPTEVPANSEFDAAPQLIYPHYHPSPASVIDSDYAEDGSPISRAACTGCSQRSEFMAAQDTFRWVDAHNESCKS